MKAFTLIASLTVMAVLGAAQFSTAEEAKKPACCDAKCCVENGECCKKDTCCKDGKCQCEGGKCVDADKACDGKKKSGCDKGSKSGCESKSE